LSDIEVTAKKAEQAREMLVALVTSTKAKGLAPFTKAQLLESLAELKTHAPPEAELSRDVLPSDPHPTIVAMLAEYRQSIFNIKPELKDKLEKRALDSFESNTTVASCKADLSCQFHSFSGCTSLVLLFAVKVNNL
jgi:predicted Zn-dependent protease